MHRYDGNTGRFCDVPEPPGRGPDPGYAESPPPKGIGSGLQGLLSHIFAQGFDTEDLLLFAVLFLLYQETKDKELLIIMGGMFLL